MGGLERSLGDPISRSFGLKVKRGQEASGAGVTVVIGGQLGG